jgi:GNAT superfamily N-acetyltransferase
VIELQRILDADAAEACEVLFREYGKWSIDRLAETHGMTMSAQDVETAHRRFRDEWPKLFGPRGRLYLVRADGEPAGVGALKPIDRQVGEIKRMYVGDAFRGRGIARLILRTIVEDARVIGYRVLRLETLDYMTDAHRLYRSFGFVDAPRFEAEGSDTGLAQYEIFMELAITSG